MDLGLHGIAASSGSACTASHRRAVARAPRDRLRPRRARGLALLHARALDDRGGGRPSSSSSSVGGGAASDDSRRRPECCRRGSSSSTLTAPSSPRAERDARRSADARGDLRCAGPESRPTTSAGKTDPRIIRDLMLAAGVAEAGSRLACPPASRPTRWRSRRRGGREPGPDATRRGRACPGARGARRPAPRTAHGERRDRRAAQARADGALAVLPGGRLRLRRPRPHAAAAIAAARVERLTGPPCRWRS